VPWTTLRARFQVGEIISTIQSAGFSILALQSFHLDFAKAEEFLEVCYTRRYCFAIFYPVTLLLLKLLKFEKSLFDREFTQKGMASIIRFFL
jgi:nucleoside diphosphate kinase